MQHQAQIGVFGGSGFYSFLDNVIEIAVETPYGMPASKVAIADIHGKKVAFLPRHGKNHEYPPHKIPYRANLWVMKSLGVKQIIGPNACGSLQSNVKPGDFVVCDQFIDRTYCREQTFYDGPITTHVSAADPYCPILRDIAINKSKALNIPVHDKGTVVVIQGPRFSTRAESKWFASQGWEVINMTQYPECYLARELEMCYVNISLITDFDVGLEGQGGIKPVTHEEVIKIFTENNAKVKELLMQMIKEIDPAKACSCQAALTGAR